MFNLEGSFPLNNYSLMTRWALLELILKMLLRNMDMVIKKN